MGFRPDGLPRPVPWWEWEDPYDPEARAQRQAALWRGVLARLRAARVAEEQARAGVAEVERYLASRPPGSGR
jgi:hypothetical protein